MLTPNLSAVMDFALVACDIVLIRRYVRMHVLNVVSGVLILMDGIISDTVLILTAVWRIELHVVRIVLWVFTTVQMTISAYMIDMLAVRSVLITCTTVQVSPCKSVQPA